MREAGIGLRAPHYRELLASGPALALLEVHSENFFGDGGPALAWLERFRAHYPVSLHGVGLSLGSVDPLDERHLAQLARLVERVQPSLVSEHLCWSSVDGRHANELLPLPNTPEAIAHVVPRIQAVQERLGRRILVENVSAYAALPGSAMPEWEFVAEVARRAGCGILLDLNNVFVNAANFAFEARRYVEAIPPELVGEYHLAGHAREDGLLVDTHAARVDAGVWALYAQAVERIGPRPTVVEWDAQLPPLALLLEEARHAQQAMDRRRERAPLPA